MTGTAIVVGGGVGGLAAALGLQGRGWDVTVFERATGLPETGTGLGIWPEALSALDGLGLGAAVRDAGQVQGDGVVLRPDGSRIGTLRVGKLAEPVRLVTRPVLLGLLYGGLGAGTVRFGETVTSLPSADVVVVADGIRSRLREKVFGPGAALRPAGGYVWRGTSSAVVASGGEVWGRGRKFGFTPQADGLTNFYAVHYAPMPSVEDIGSLSEGFAGWCDPVGRVISGIRPGALRHELNYLGPALSSYVSGNVALVGDAAHAMTPDLGQGACQALIDGLVLAQCLTQGGGLPEYDRLRRKASQRVAAMSRTVGRLAAWRWTRTRDLVAKGLLAAA